MAEKQWLPTNKQKLDGETNGFQNLRNEWKSRDHKPSSEIIAGYVRDAIALITAKNIYEIGNEQCPHVNYGLHKREYAMCWQVLFKEIESAEQ